MLINFCNNKLVESITCSASECDGHGVSNLISDQECQRKKGFLVDYFIKPPVTVLIKFVCDINLDHLIIWPRVGNQKTSGIEISTSLCGNVFNSIACGSIKQDEVGFLFCKYSNTCKMKNISDNFFIRSFKSERHLRVSFLQIHIFKTFGSSIPALQKLEIWGNLCRDCTKETTQMVMNVWSKSGDNQEKNKFLKSCNSSDKNLCSNREPVIDVSQLQIPEEFIDPITNEIMIIPMILPSGNVVDTRTLEKFIDEESKWGRSPSDPFTGKVFTKISNPKISVALKARIDKFLVDNCNEPCITNVARTLGSDKYIVGPRTSSLVTCDKGNCSNQSYKTTESVELNERIIVNKRKHGSETDLRSATNNCDNKLAKHSKLLHEHSILKTCVVDASSFDQQKERSLESVLKSTLSNLPTFASRNSLSHNNAVTCCKCASYDNLYLLPCKHHICRSCLCLMTKTNLCKCILCSMTFSSNDPKKIHIV